MTTMLNWEDYHKEDTTPAGSAVANAAAQPEEITAEPATP